MCTGADNLNESKRLLFDLAVYLNFSELYKKKKKTEVAIFVTAGISLTLYVKRILTVWRF